LGLIKKAGAFLSYGDTRLGQGRENARDFLKKNPKIAWDIDGQIRRQTLTGHQFQPETPVVDAPVQAEETAEIGTLDTASLRA
jgi:recombination protein RecA